MGQSFTQIIYDPVTKDFVCYTSMFYKLPEIVYNKWFSGYKYLKEKPYCVMYLGNESFVGNRRVYELWSDWDNYGEKYKNLTQNELEALFLQKYLGFGKLLPKTTSDYDFDYTGFLVNHTKKQALDLAKYYKKSKNGKDCIDPLPVLTETGCGTYMLFCHGCLKGGNVELATTWCGDLLQLTDELPSGYEEIECYFVETDNNCLYENYQEYGTDSDGALLKNSEGERLLVAKLGFSMNSEEDFARLKEKEIAWISCEKEDGKVAFVRHNIDT